MNIRQTFYPSENDRYYTEQSLDNIRYSDFFEEPDVDDFPYDSACQLLCGSCHIFALSLQKLLHYDVYVIEANIKKTFHAFCKVCRNGVCYFVDVRGITSNIDEFKKGIEIFIHNEHTIRPVSDDDIRKWEEDSNKYDKEGYEFAEAVIKKYKKHYTV